MSMDAAVYGGPAVHKLERANPTEVIVRLMREKPRASRESIERLFLSEIKDDDDYLTACLRYYFWNAWAGLHPEPRAKSTRASEARVKAACDKLKAVIISKLIMPNGKPVADCTGSEMGKFGRFGLAVSKIVGRRQKVGTKMSEEELCKLYLQTR